MLRARLSMAFSLLTGLLFALTAFAQQQPSDIPGSSPRQPTQETATNADPSVVKAGATPADATGGQQKENAVISKPDHRVRVHLGGLSVGAGYSHFSGFAPLPLYSRFGGWGYPAYWGFYEPLWWSPFWFPYGSYGGLAPGPRKGQVKLKVEPKTAEVWIDGGFAGSVASLKGEVALEPGAYDFCFKAAGHENYCRRIYVLGGKALDVLAKLPPAPAEVVP